MKKIIKKILLFFSFAALSAFFLTVAGMQFPFCGNMFFSLIFGECYTSSGKCIIKTKNKKVAVDIYTAPGKNFVLLGPYRFDNTTEDFFFVNRHQVLRSATDKGGDTWFRCGKYLFILDDMSGKIILRTSYWDMLADEKKSYVKYYQKSNKYFFFLNDRSMDLPAEFSIPAELLPKNY